MRAIRIDAVGGPGVLTEVELPDPVPASGELLVRVAAVGVSFADTLIRAGSFPAPLQLPAVLGREAVGTVCGHGPGVAGPPVGTRVACRLPVGGGYAQLVTVPTARAISVPDQVSDAQAVAVIGAGVTAQGVVEAAGIRPDDLVVVLAAAGSTGVLVTQLVRRRGARVIGLAGTAAKRELVSSLGAEWVFGSSGDWVAQVREATGGEGVDVVLDSVGGPALESGLRLLADDGRLLLYGFASGSFGRLDHDQLGALAAGNRQLRGFTVRVDDATAAEQITELLRQVGQGRLVVPVTERHGLTELRRAHADLQDRRTSGKVVITV